MRYVIILLSIIAAANAKDKQLVLYCVETDSTGFYPENESNKLKHTMIKPERYTLRVAENYSHIQLTPSDGGIESGFTCRASDDSKNYYSCSNMIETLTINSENLRFTFARQAGWTAIVEFPIALSYGTCTKF